MKSKGKNAISLIVLVITILVLSILAATVIISLSNTNIIGETSKTVLKSNLTTMQDMATVYFADNYETIDMEKEYLITEFGITDDEFKDYRDYALVKAGKVYIKANAPEDIQEVAEELNMLIDGTSSSTGEVAVEKTVKSLRIYGNTESEESVGEKSKNLFNPEKWTAPVTESGVTVQYLEDEDCFLLNGTATKTVSVGHKYINIPTEIGKSYILSNKYVSGSVDRSECTGNTYAVSHIGKSDTINTFSNWMSANLTNDSSLEYSLKTSDAQYITAIWFYISEGVKFENYKVKVMIEQSDEATDYEPYGYKVPVKARGKNLLNEKSIASITINADGWERYGWNLGVLPAGNYQLTVFGNYVDAKPISYKTITDGVYSTYTALATPNNLSKTIQLNGSQSLIIYMYQGLTELYDNVTLQLEEGSTATNYEAYKEPITTNIYLTEPLRKVGNVADYIDCTTGEVVRYIGVTEAGELQVLGTPIKENATLEEMNFEGVTHIVVDTTVTPSNIEVKY